MNAALKAEITAAVLARSVARVARFPGWFSRPSDPPPVPPDVCIRASCRKEAVEGSLLCYRHQPGFVKRRNQW